MAAAAAHHAGADVWVTARHPHQAAAAQRLASARVFTGANAANELAQAADEQPIDLVVETVGGGADTLMEAVQVVRRGGSVIVLGIFTTFPTLNALLLVVREVRLIGSMTYGRSVARADFDVALDILGRRGDALRSLITHRVALPDIAQGFELAADKRSGAIKVTVANR
jgi:threonine dehydrogenase-like Zn-dependent dehydrogenase